MKQKLFFLVFCAFFNPACKEKKISPEISFYYWRTVFEPNKIELDYLTKLNVKKLYVRFFDIDWNPQLQNVQAIAEIDFKENNLENTSIVPTVFITNRTFERLSPDKLGMLEGKILNKLFAMTRNLKEGQINEIQLDCDWTDKTKDKFFGLIVRIKNKLDEKKIRISATIRLHQFVWFEKSGIPPVDEGVLMFYNIGKIKDENTFNSILDLKTAEDYLKNARDYPIRLNLALPLFSWAVLKRKGKVIDLINNLSAEDLYDSKKYIKTKENHFKIIQNHYLNTVYLYKNDLIRIEETDLQLLHQLIELLKKYNLAHFESVILYHLSSKSLRNYSVLDFQKMMREF